MKNRNFKILALFGCLLVLPTAVLAFAVEHGNSVYVPESKTIDGNYYAAGQNITIDGRVMGDVICAGQSLAINGTVEGDVICAGQSVSINGNIGGSLRAAASDINIRGVIDRSVLAAAANMNIEKSAKVGWDATIAAANAQVRGDLGRSLLGAGANYVLGGNIAGDATLYLDNNAKNRSTELSVGETAVIGGTLYYTSATDASISDQAQLKGAVVHKLPAVSQERRLDSNAYAGAFIISLVSALIAGLVLTRLFPRSIISLTEKMSQEFWLTLGSGFLMTIVTPVVVVLLAITIVGFRLALITAWTWLTLLMFSKIVASIAIGQLLVKKYWATKKESLGTVMVLGVIISWLIFYIPIIGWIVSVIAAWWGMGGLIIYLKQMYDEHD